jgi:hypothetical protein
LRLQAAETSCAEAPPTVNTGFTSNFMMFSLIYVEVSKIEQNCGIVGA